MIPNKPLAARPFVITFSGIDGAGKTTQIEYLSSCLQKLGLRVARLSFLGPRCGLVENAGWSRRPISGACRRTRKLGFHSPPRTTSPFGIGI